jgi:glycosyltransferase involved in cell wall biosynthesis
MKVSALVIAKNEEGYIADCLEHLKPYVDEIVVLDGDSTDSTVKESEPFADKIFIESLLHISGDFGSIRTIGQNLCTYDWVLHCDVDERFPETFLKNIRTIIHNSQKTYGALSKNQLPAFRFPRINLEFIKDLKNTKEFNFNKLKKDAKKYYPDYQIRLLDRKVCDWRKKLHEIPYHKKYKEPVDVVAIRTLDRFPMLHLRRDYKNKEREWWKERNE